MARLSTPICFAALAMLMGAMAQAATLDRIEGSVLVNHRGNGYVAVVSTQLQPGDSVVANPGGRGQIFYEDGCTVTAEEGKVILIQEQSPCVRQASAAGAHPYRLGVGDASAGGGHAHGRRTGPSLPSPLPRPLRGSSYCLKMMMTSPRALKASQFKISLVSKQPGLSEAVRNYC